LGQRFNRVNEETCFCGIGTTEKALPFMKAQDRIVRMRKILADEDDFMIAVLILVKEGGGRMGRGSNNRSLSRVERGERRLRLLFDAWHFLCIKIARYV
jgi:hypothetical protein